MKKLILSFLFIVFCVGYVSDRSVLPYTAETNGPVKKMTVIRNEPAAQVVEVYYYDSIGRLTDYMHRINDNEVYLQNYPPTPPTCFKRQYRLITSILIITTMIAGSLKVLIHICNVIPVGMFFIQKDTKKANWSTWIRRFITKKD